jgi:hypothetical protein
MSTPLRSAYPEPVSALIPKARKLADELGAAPSRNRLMKELRIGSDKAKAVLAALHDQAAVPSAAATQKRLQAVPSQAAAEKETAETETGPEAPSEAFAQVRTSEGPVPSKAEAEVHRSDRPVRSWPVLLLALPAFVAVWSGWVGLGELTGFGEIRPLPGIADGLVINTAITLPIGVETYAAYALRVWLSGQVPARARRFAKWSALGSLVLGALGQVAYHLLDAAGRTTAPWQITTVVACLPVAVLGMGAALAHLLHIPPDHADDGENQS